MHIHYAVKTNVDTEVLREVLKDGCGFDCASMFEIDKVLALGANPEHIIFAHPCKTLHMINHAKKVGVRWFTFDSEEEAEKIHRLFPEAQLILRIAVTETDAPRPMSKKFGAPQELVESILLKCHKINISVRGVSFHVGSGGCSFESYLRSLVNAQQVFETYERLTGKQMDILDIGGGFSMNADNKNHNFDYVAKKVNDYLT